PLSRSKCWTGGVRLRTRRRSPVCDRFTAHTGSSGQSITRTLMIGRGRMARAHLRSMLAQQDTTQVVVVSEPDAAAYDAVVAQYQEVGLTPPPNEPDLERLLQSYGSELDAAFIITPHAYHYAQTKACLEAG